MEKPILYVLNEVYLGVMMGQYMQVLVDRNKGGSLNPRPFVSESDTLRKARINDFKKFPLSSFRYYSYLEH